ncbi:DUF1129 domain-containing protein [Enterococcus nangangensis]|uniref:DUF1129 domain-containing protein n=1 Tax=Enterococcus nangangensis TaxID=2559926 RepID=UPI0010F9CC34|nr:DUF1129 domain-containing protein [Enterococcus nangangensis]
MHKEQTPGEKFQTATSKVYQELTPANQKYFGKLQLYLKTAGLFYDDDEVQEQIFQIAADLLTAQRDGLTAEEFLGTKPREMANQLVRNFKKEKPNNLFWWSLMTVGLMWFLLLMDGAESLNVLTYLLSAVVVVLVTFTALKIFHFAVYEGKNALLNWGRKRPGLFTGLLFILVVSLLVVIQLFTPAIWVWQLAFPANILFLAIFGLGLTGVLYKVLGKAGIPFLIIVMGYLIMNIIANLPSTREFFQQTIPGILLKSYGPLFFYLLYLFRVTRSIKKQK